MGRKRKLRAAREADGKNIIVNCKLPGDAGVSSSTQNSEEQSASLDLTVTYDYTCPEDTSSGDPVKSMEELSGLFSFKDGGHPSSAMPSALWADLNLQPPPRKKSKDAHSSQSLPELKNLVSTIDKLKQKKNYLACDEVSTSEEGHQTAVYHNNCVSSDSDREDGLFWIEAAQQLSQQEDSEDQEGEYSLFFQEEEFTNSPSASTFNSNYNPHTIVPVSSTEKNYYNPHQIELKRLKAIQLLTQKR